VSYPDYLGEPAQLPGRGESARPARVRDWPHAEWLAVAAVSFGALTTSLDTGVVTIAYPQLAHQLHRSLSQIAWLVLVSQLTIVTTLVLFGKRADTVGRKRVYLDGFMLFLVGAVACAVAPNFYFLLGARVLEALGVAMIQANSVALVTSSVQSSHRSTALGIQASAQALGLATGPLIGGLLIGSVGWRMIFLVSAPLALVAFGASIFFLPRSRTSSPSTPLNFSSAAVLAFSVGGLIGGLTLLARFGWSLAAVLALTMGLVASAAMIPIERASPSPIFDRTLLAQRVIRRSLTSVVMTWASFFGLLTCVPFFVERVLEQSTLASGVVMMATPAGLIVSATVIGRVQRWVSRAVLARSASALIALGALTAALSSHDWQLVVALAVVGIGMGASNTMNATTVMHFVNDRERGVGSGLINLARALGSALGVAVASVAIEMSAPHQVRHALWVVVVVAFFGVVTAWRQSD
jgi:MFS family permease